MHDFNLLLFDHLIQQSRSFFILLVVDKLAGLSDLPCDFRAVIQDVDVDVLGRVLVLNPELYELGLWVLHHHDRWVVVHFRLLLELSHVGVTVRGTHRVHVDGLAVRGGVVGLVGLVHWHLVSSRGVVHVVHVLLVAVRWVALLQLVGPVRECASVTIWTILSCWVCERNAYLIRKTCRSPS